MSFWNRYKDHVRSVACVLIAPALVGVMVSMTYPDPPRQVEVDSFFDAFKPTAEPVNVKTRPAIDAETATLYEAEVQRLAGIVSPRSPFPAGDPPAAAQGEEVPAGTPETPAPRFTLTSVLSGAGGEICVINRRAFRVGGVPATGWSVVAIDAENRSVTLRGPDGRETVFEQRLPGTE